MSLSKVIVIVVLEMMATRLPSVVFATEPQVQIQQAFTHRTVEH